MQSLENRVVIVTGAARGLGRAIARGCAAAGARVVLADREAAENDALAAEIVAGGGTAVAIATDVSRMTDLERLCQAAVAEFGRIDGLVNNAGVNFVKPFLEVSEAEWDRVLDIDLKGSFFSDAIRRSADGCPAAGRRGDRADRQRAHAGRGCGGGAV